MQAFQGSVIFVTLVSVMVFALPLENRNSGALQLNEGLGMHSYGQGNNFKRNAQKGDFGNSLYAKSDKTQDDWLSGDLKDDLFLLEKILKEAKVRGAILENKRNAQNKENVFYLNSPSDIKVMGKPPSVNDIVNTIAASILRKNDKTASEEDIIRALAMRSSSINHPSEEMLSSFEDIDSQQGGNDDTEAVFPERGLRRPVAVNMPFKGDMAKRSWLSVNAPLNTLADYVKQGRKKKDQSSDLQNLGK